MSSSRLVTRVLSDAQVVRERPPCSVLDVLAKAEQERGPLHRAVSVEVVRLLPFAVTEQQFSASVVLGEVERDLRSLPIVAGTDDLPRDTLVRRELVDARRDHVVVE